MLRSILQRAAATGPRAQAWYLSSPANYSSAKNTKSNVKKAKKSKGGAATAADESPAGDVDGGLFDEGSRAMRLAADEKDPTLDVGPNGRPLFTSTPSLSQLTRKDACSYLKFKYDKNPNYVSVCICVRVIWDFD